MSRLPMLGSANKKPKTEASATAAAPTAKRNASTSSLRGLSSSAGKVQPGITRQTSASGKALFTGMSYLVQHRINPFIGLCLFYDQ